MILLLFRIYLVSIIFLLIPILSYAQVVGEVSNIYSGIYSNINAVIASDSQTLVLGNRLVYRIEGETTWQIPMNAKLVSEEGQDVYSIYIKGNTILAGLGYEKVTQTDLGSSTTPVGLGYYYSVDRGKNWLFTSLPLDDFPPEDCVRGSIDSNGCDITFEYGDNVYQRIRFLVPEQSPPYEVAFQDSVWFSVNWAMGLIRSRDNGQSWDRIILPPSIEDELVPNKSYNFISYENGVALNRYDPRHDSNLLGFSILIDSYGYVWVGTGGGVNVSENVISHSPNLVSWKHYYKNETSNSLIGNWVITIKENPKTKDIWMTNWPAGENENFGIVVTKDRGNTYQSYLEGYRIYDIGFIDDIIYAAGELYLFASYDLGATWEIIDDFHDDVLIRLDPIFYSVTTFDNEIWIGTNDGLLRYNTQDNKWYIERVNYPLVGGNRHEIDTKDVDGYAYPNPFSPTYHSILRLKFDVLESGRVTIELFDFAMNLIKILDDKHIEVGTYEAVWDGTSNTGRQVSNGVVFYRVKTKSKAYSGKILIVN